MASPITQQNIGVVNNVLSQQDMLNLWGNIKFDGLLTNYINHNIYDNNIMLNAYTFQGNNLNIEIAVRGQGSLMNEANPDSYSENNITAQTINFITNNKVQYAVQFPLNKFQEKVDFQEFIARQGKFAIDWLTKYVGTLTRYRVKQFALALNQYIIAPNYYTAGTDAQYYFNLLYIWSAIHTLIWQNINAINMMLDQDSLVSYISYLGAKYLTKSASQFGGSNSAFQVFEDGEIQRILGDEYKKDVYIGAVNTNVYNSTFTNVEQSMNLSNIISMFYCKYGLIKAINPQYTHTFSFQAYTAHELYQWSVDVVGVPQFFYTCWVLLDQAPTLQEVNNARALLTSQQPAYAPFFNTPPSTTGTNGTAILPQLTQAELTSIQNNLTYNNDGNLQLPTINVSINEEGMYNPNYSGSTIPTNVTPNLGATIQNIQSNLPNSGTSDAFTRNPRIKK